MRASDAPVTNRRAITLLPPGANSTAAFAAPPTSEPTNINVREFTMSAMFDNALNKVPTTKPACTAIVSHGACAWEILNSSMRRGVTAVAENHNVMPRNWATEITASIRHAVDLSLNQIPGKPCRSRREVPTPASRAIPGRPCHPGTSLDLYERNLSFIRHGGAMRRYRELRHHRF